LTEHAAENNEAARFYDRIGFNVAWIEEGQGPGATTNFVASSCHSRQPRRSSGLRPGQRATSATCGEALGWASVPE
jgi:hypothetical protein